MAGYLEKRGKRSWRLIVSHGFDSYGNRIKYTKSIKANSRREADKELVNFVYEVENGIVLQNSSMTFKEFTVQNGPASFFYSMDKPPRIWYIAWALFCGKEWGSPCSTWRIICFNLHFP